MILFERNPNITNNKNCLRFQTKSSVAELYDRKIKLSKGQTNQSSNSSKNVIENKNEEDDIYIKKKKIKKPITK